MGVILLKLINHISQFYRKEHYNALQCIILNININIHDFMQRNFIFKFDDIVNFNSIKCIHRVFYNKSKMNLQIRLKNKMIVINLLESHLKLLETYFV